MKFPTSKGNWDYSSVLAVLKLDGRYGVEGVDYHLYKDGNWKGDTVETGVDLTEGIVIHKVPSVRFEPDAVWKAVIRGNKVLSDEPITGEKKTKRIKAQKLCQLTKQSLS